MRRMYASRGQNPFPTYLGAGSGLHRETLQTARIELEALSHQELVADALCSFESLQGPLLIYETIEAGPCYARQAAHLRCGSFDFAPLALPQDDIDGEEQWRTEENPTSLRDVGHPKFDNKVSDQRERSKADTICPSTLGARSARLLHAMLIR